MIRKTIVLLVLVALAGFGFAPASKAPKPCPQTCQVDKDCRHYPDQVCLNGCCVF
jgi:hypothetical protein